MSIDNLDTDKDGLTDEYEKEIGTNHLDKDTDKDGFRWYRSTISNRSSGSLFVVR